MVSISCKLQLYNNDMKRGLEGGVSPQFRNTTKHRRSQGKDLVLLGNKPTPPPPSLSLYCFLSREQCKSSYGYLRRA